MSCSPGSAGRQASPGRTSCFNRLATGQLKAIPDRTHHWSHRGGSLAELPIPDEAASACLTIGRSRACADCCWPPATRSWLGWTPDRVLLTKVAALLVLSG